MNPRRAGLDTTYRVRPTAGFKITKKQIEYNR